MSPAGWSETPDVPVDVGDLPAGDWTEPAPAGTWRDDRGVTPVPRTESPPLRGVVQRPVVHRDPPRRSKRRDGGDDGGGVPPIGPALVTAGAVVVGVMAAEMYAYMTALLARGGALALDPKFASVAGRHVLHTMVNGNPHHAVAMSDLGYTMIVDSVGDMADASDFLEHLETVGVPQVRAETLRRALGRSGATELEYRWGAFNVLARHGRRATPTSIVESIIARGDIIRSFRRRLCPPTLAIVPDGPAPCRSTAATYTDDLINQIYLALELHHRFKVREAVRRFGAVLTATMQLTPQEVAATRWQFDDVFDRMYEIMAARTLSPAEEIVRDRLYWIANDSDPVAETIRSVVAIGPS